MPGPRNRPRTPPFKRREGGDLPPENPPNCVHRCHCSCHRTGAKHAFACCSTAPCGHTQVRDKVTHMRECHAAPPKRDDNVF